MRSVLLIISSCLIFAFGKNARAQSPEAIDSLKNLLKKELSDKDRASVNNRLARNFLRSDSSLTFQYTQKAIDLAEKAKYYDGIADAHYTIGVFFRRKGNLAKAQEYYLKSKEVSEKHDYLIGKTVAYNGLGIINMQLGNYDEAVDYFQKTLEVDQEIGNQENAAYDLGHIGLVYKARGDLTKAIEYYKQALKIHQEISNDQGIAETYNNMSLVYSDQGNLPRALDFLFKSLKIKEKLGDPYNIIPSYGNIGGIYARMEDYNRAVYYYKKAEKISQENDYKFDLADAYIDLGSLYNKKNDDDSAFYYYQKSRQLGQQIGSKDILAFSLHGLGVIYLGQEKLDSAKALLEEAHQLRVSMGENKELAATKVWLGATYSELGDYQPGLEYAMKGLEIARQSGGAAETKNAYRVLSQIQEDRGNLSDALANFKAFKMISDSLLNADNTRQIARLETQYEYEKREEKLKLEQAQKEFALQQRNQRNLYFLYGLALVLVFVAISAVLYYRYSRQLRRLNATKDKLFAIVAHDLKNPLSAFRSITQSLSENLGEIGKEEIQYFLEKINKSSYQLYDLLQNLLQWAISQTGEMEYKPQSLGFKDLGQEIMGQLETNAEVKKITLQNEVDPQLEVLADQKMTGLVLRNLLSNAIKFTPEGGEVRIKAFNEGNHVRIEVKDNGIGMSPEDQNKLFKIEEDPHKIGDAKEKGTGIGLILCKELVQKQRGDIWVESKLQEGSTFIFTLPSPGN